jgi:hypothetical protein
MRWNGMEGAGRVGEGRFEDCGENGGDSKGNDQVEVGRTDEGGGVREGETTRCQIIGLKGQRTT